MLRDQQAVALLRVLSCHPEHMGAAVGCGRWACGDDYNKALDSIHAETEWEKCRSTGEYLKAAGEHLCRGADLAAKAREKS